MEFFRIYSVFIGFVLVLCIGCSSDNGDEDILSERSEVQFQLSIEIIPKGAGAVIPGAGSYAKGHEVTLRAVANDGYFFSYWEGETSSKEPSHSIVMDSDKRITAVFFETQKDLRDQR